MEYTKNNAWKMLIILNKKNPKYPGIYKTSPKFHYLTHKIIKKDLRICTRSYNIIFEIGIFDLFN